MRRATTVPSAPGGSCDYLRVVYENMERFLDFKDSIMNRTNTLGVYISGSLASDLQGGGTPEEQAEKQQRVNQQYGDLSFLEQRMAEISKCLQNEIIQKQQFSGELYSLQQEVNQKEGDVKQMEETSKEAQERAQLLDTPYSKTNRWEAWFPLGRPLQKESLPVLLSLALLFLTLALGMFLRLASIDLRIHWFDFSGVGTLSGYGIGR